MTTFTVHLEMEVRGKRVPFELSADSLDDLRAELNKLFENSKFTYRYIHEVMNLVPDAKKQGRRGSTFCDLCGDPGVTPKLKESRFFNGKYCARKKGDSYCDWKEES